MRRERFMRAMTRQEEDYIPFEFCFSDTFYRKFVCETGQKDYFEYYEMPVRFVLPNYIGKERYNHYFKDSESLQINMWGIGYQKGTFEHYSKIVYPLDFDIKVEDIENFPFIDPENDFDWPEFEKEIESLKNRDLITYGAMAATIFELAWQLIGFERLLLMLHDDAPAANLLIEKITDIRVQFAKKYASIGVDCLHTGDDVSTQIDMMMSPDLWRKYFKSNMKTIFDAAKNIKGDILIDYHGDGNLERIIPDLIEIGVDILNPVQPECINPYKIKAEFGDRLSFRGGLGTQSTLPFSTSREITDECMKLCSKLGKGGGFMLCPTHMIQPEVPWENFMAYIDVLKNYT